MTGNDHSIQSDKDNHKELEKLSDECEENNLRLHLTTPDNSQRYVIGSGYLLRRAIWDRDVNFRDYSEIFVSRWITLWSVHYCFRWLPGWSFDKRSLTFSKKSENNSFSLSVHPNSSIGIAKQKSFLANPNNKESFIGLQAQALASDGHDVIRCQEDADTATVSSVVHLNIT